MAKLDKEDLLKLLKNPNVQPLLEVPEVQEYLKQITQPTRPLPSVSHETQALEQKNEASTQQLELDQLKKTKQETEAMIKELKEIYEQFQSLYKKFKSLFEQKQDEPQALRTELEQTQEQNAQQQETIDQLIHSIEDCERLKQQLQDQIDPFKPLQPLLEAYACYQQLSPNTQTSLQGIFSQDNFSVFIAAGIQQKNLEALHDYLKNELLEGQNPDQAHLVALFNPLLEAFLQSTPKYEKTSPQQQTFNPTQHIKTPDSPPAGTIKSVLLPGWRVKSNQKPIKQPIVKL